MCYIYSVNIQCETGAEPLIGPFILVSKCFMVGCWRKMSVLETYNIQASDRNTVVVMASRITGRMSFSH